MSTFFYRIIHTTAYWCWRTEYEVIKIRGQCLAGWQFAVYSIQSEMKILTPLPVLLFISAYPTCCATQFTMTGIRQSPPPTSGKSPIKTTLATTLHPRPELNIFCNTETRQVVGISTYTRPQPGQESSLPPGLEHRPTPYT